MQACVIYTFTQLCKMLMLATFFDVDLLNTNENFSMMAVSGIFHFARLSSNI